MKNTLHTVVIPFYIYAAVSFLVATVLLACSGSALTQHYFHPRLLAITHIMALGWGTMIILGSSHQLLPVLIEGNLYSRKLAQLSFILAAAGIPLLVYAFYIFDFGWQARWGGTLVNAGVLSFVLNVAISIRNSKQENVHAIFLFTAACWLLATTAIGLALVYNFNYDFLPKDSLAFLSLHMHLGIIGWFLLLVVGVGSRLLPMFFISKYTNTKQLWLMYALINLGLTAFVIMFLQFHGMHKLAVLPVALALVLFARFCYRAYRARIRRQVDGQMKLSILSVLMIFIPLLFVIVISRWSAGASDRPGLAMAYGFTIFFGWITSIILGMTFKTLPFIIWNKVYEEHAGLVKTPQPADLFSSKLFKAMSLSYLAGFILFLTGLLNSHLVLLNFSSGLLIAAALFYNLNVFKLVLHERHNQ